MAKKIEPLSDRIVLLPVKSQETTKGGIYLPDTAKEKPQEGKVLAVGPGKLSDDGKRLPMDIKVGDIVLYPRYGGVEYKLDDEDVEIFHQSDLLGIISGKSK